MGRASNKEKTKHTLSQEHPGQLDQAMLEFSWFLAWKLCNRSFSHSLHAFRSVDQVRCSRHSMAALQP